MENFITETVEYNPEMQRSIDTLGEHYLSKLQEHVDNNNIENSDAIFQEYVVDGVEPDSDSYEWLFMDYLKV